MDSSVLQKTGCRAVVALLGLIAGMGTMQATTNVLTTVSGSTAVALTCSATNPTATVSIKAVTTNATVSGIGLVTPLPSSITVTEVGSGTALSSTTTSLSFTVALATPGNGCAGLPPSVTFNFKTSTTTSDVGITVSFTNLGNQLTATPSPSPLNLVCDPSGSSSTTGTVTIKPVMQIVSPATIAVAATGAVSPLQVTAPGSPSLTNSNQTAGLAFTIGFGSGCAGLPASEVITFTAGGTADVTVTVNITTLGIVASPSSVTITCTKTGASTYSAGPSVNVSITGVGGSYAWTISSPPSWVTPGALSGTASSSASTLTFTADSPCDSLSGGQSVTGNVTLTATSNSALSKTISVTLNVLDSSPLVASPTAPSLSYVKGSGNPGKVAVAITASPASPAPYFSVNTATVPAWLTVDSIAGTTPKTLNFSSTSIADSLAPGTYTATIHLSIATYTDKLLTITLLITNKAPTLSLSPAGTTVTQNWTVGASVPTINLNVVSSDTPIPYTISTGGPLAPIVAQTSGLAYNFGTQIPVTFNSSVFASAQPGNVLTGTVSIVWGQPASTTVVTINLDVLSAAASLSSVAPAGLPTATSGTFTLSFSGTGFVAGTGSGSTKLGIVSNGTLVFDPYVVATVTNTGISAVITVPPGGNDVYLPFSTATSANVVFGVCNPVPPATSCTTPTGGTQQVTISSGPIISAVTSASSFVQSATPTVAPYDMVSIFGANFCPVCSSSTVMYGSLNSTTLRYGTSLLSPDNTNSISVSLYAHGASPTSGNLIANAPLLFGTNSQINALIPGTVNPTNYAGGVDVYVNWGPIPATVATKSNLVGFMLALAGSDPGIFTVGEDGQGPGAILSQNWSVISSSNPAAMRHTTSDTVSIWMTGLGAPDSAGDDTQAGTNGGWVYPTDCVTISSFQTALDTLEGISSSTNLDGAILQTAALDTNRQVPCFLSTDMSVTVGGASTAITYAGWTPTSVAGLYQIDVTLPATSASLTDVNGNPVTSFTAPMQLPVVVTVGTGLGAPTSQNGVTIWVAPRLQVSTPTVIGGTVGVLWGLNTNGTNTCSTTPTDCEVVASDSTTSGTASYKYAITSGALPAGLALTASGSDPNAIVTITGTPAANTAGTYQVTVTATDTSMTPVLTGSTTFTITIAGGLYVTRSGSISNSLVSGTAANVVLVSASGGVAPYTYTIASTINGQTLPATVSVNASGEVVISAQMPAGTFPVAVTATDSNGLTGTYSFQFIVPLNVTTSSLNTVTAASGGVLTTATTTGQTGTVTYTVTAVDNSNSGATFAGVSMNGSILSVDTSGTQSHNYTATITATDSGTASGSSAAAVTTKTVTFTLN